MALVGGGRGSSPNAALETINERVRTVANAGAAIPTAQRRRIMNGLLQFPAANALSSRQDSQQLLDVCAVPQPPADHGLIISVICQARPIVRGELRSSFNKFPVAGDA